MIDQNRGHCVGSPAGHRLACSRAARATSRRCCCSVSSSSLRSTTGWVMGHRPSNVQRNRWAVGLLDVQPSERVIELGCGPGVALQALAERASQGLVVGVDHSEVMIRQATRRNAAAFRSGSVRLVHSPVEDLEPGVVPFDAVLAVNSIGFWPQPATLLREVRQLLRPGGRIALVSQPRCPGATAATSAKAADELTRLLAEAGFKHARVETLDLDPPVVCVLALDPGAG